MYGKYCLHLPYKSTIHVGKYTSPMGNTFHPLNTNDRVPSPNIYLLAPRRCTAVHCTTLSWQRRSSSTSLSKMSSEEPLFPTRNVWRITLHLDDLYGKFTWFSWYIYLHLVHVCSCLCFFSLRLVSFLGCIIYQLLVNFHGIFTCIWRIWGVHV